MIERFFKLNWQMEELNRKLDRVIESKLGDGWGLTPQTDGVCLIDSDCHNYSLPINDLLEVLKLDRDNAIKIIHQYEI